MRFRVYTATSMAKAKDQIRRELGENALIISHAENKSTGEVRVTAALDEDPALQNEPATPEDTLTPDHIFSLMAFHNVPVEFQELLRLHLNEAYEFSPEEGFHANPFGVALNNMLQFEPLNIKRPMMFVGPPGVGKSVALMKLAAEAFCQATPINIFTADNLKTGAWDQLQGLARYLNKDVTLISSLSKFENTLPANDTNALTFIDTPGCNPFDQDAMVHLEEIKQKLQAQVMLVLQAGLDPEETLQIIEAYECLEPEAFIATKLDVTHKYGNILVAAQKLNALGYTASPNIGFPIVPLDGETLSALVLEPEMAYSINEEYGSLEEAAEADDKTTYTREAG